MTKNKALAAMYFWAGLAVSFAHWHMVALERDMPPIISIVCGAVWPLATLVWGWEVLG